MKTRALGFLLMVAAASVYAVGCGSSNNNGGTGGKGGAAGAGVGGAGMGGKTGMGGAAGAGMGGKNDGGPTDSGTGGKTDSGTDTPVGDAPADTQAAPTFTDVYAILSNITTPTADTAPGCLHCHDGVGPDGGAATTLPHVMNFSTKAAAFAALVGVDSLRCPGTDGGADGGGTAAVKRVLASNAAQSVLWQKLNFGLNPSMPACGGGPMPRNNLVPADGGGADAGDGGSLDAGFVQATHYAITSAQLQTVMDWINAGAANN